MPMDNDISQMEPLIPADRCDRCGAQAWVRVGIGDSALLFCNHHFAVSETGLRAVATYVHDERGQLREAEAAAPVA